MAQHTKASGGSAQQDVDVVQIVGPYSLRTEQVCPSSSPCEHAALSASQSHQFLNHPLLVSMLLALHVTQQLIIPFSVHNLSESLQSCFKTGFLPSSFVSPFLEEDFRFSVDEDDDEGEDEEASDVWVANETALRAEVLLH